MNACTRSVFPRLRVFVFLGSVAWLGLPALVQAATFNVPQDCSTIQAAINSAANGDTVLVASGTYSGDGNRDLDFGGKNIIVRSQNGAAATIIDCGGSNSAAHRGFIFQNGETASAVVSGFTIQNANETAEGAIFVDSTSGPTIQGCIFQNNVSSDSGAGLYSDGNVTVQNCTFLDNTVTSGDYQSGGGIYSDGTLTLQDCFFSGNQAGEDGGAIDIDGGSAAATNCVFSGNTASYGGAIFSFAALTLVNCTATANTSYAALYVGDTATLINDIFFGDSSTEISGSAPTTTNCDIAGGAVGTGNIDADPLFVSSPANLHLQSGSPCFGTGTASGAPTTDADGNTRPAPPSIGAYDRTTTIVPPTGLSATAGIGEITLAWTAPAGVSGATYNIYRGTGPGGETFYKTAGTATSFVNTYVTAGTTYYYTVKTVASGQTSVASNEASATATTVAAPAAPTGLTTVPRSGQVYLAWTAPAGTVVSYILYRGASASTLLVYKSGLTTTTFADASVTNGTTYYYAVAAVNTGGTGPQSTVVATTPLAIPATPTNFTANSGVGTVTLSWTAAAGTVTSYNIYRGTTSGSETIYRAATATSYVDTEGVLGTKYYYKVAAVNGSGISPESSEAAGTPAFSPLPAAPTGLTAVPHSGQVTLSWTAPAGTVTSYTVYRGASASALQVYKSGLPLARTTFADASVTNGTTYYYAVAAVNDGGTGPKSAVVVATPEALPAVPTGLTAVASGGKITLHWTAPAGPVTSYSVYRGTTSGGETFYKSAGTATTFVNTYVTPGTEYYYKVSAVNTSGTGQQSLEVHAIP